MEEIKYIAELSIRHDWPLTLSLPAIVAGEGGQIICTFETARPASSYWTNWGGHYDMPDTSHVALFLDGFLNRATSLAELLRVSKMYYIDGTKVYIHIPRYPWTYPPEHARTLTIKGYSSAPRDTNSPSDDTYMINGTRVHYPVRLGIPRDVENKLPDVISGIVLYKTFAIRLLNNDGYFDRLQEGWLFNTPLRLLKTWSALPNLDDYKTIRYGLIEDIEITATDMQIKAADINRTLDDQVCRSITKEEFPNSDPKVVDKSLPVAWGAHKGAKLIRIGTRLYAPCDPEYISQISKVYDRDGNVVPASSLIPGKLVEINPNASSITPHTCDFDGRRRDRIGEIIIDEIEAKSRIPYTAGNWDTSESNRYISTSPKVGIVVYRGKVRELIATCLKNDSAFLIIKNDGRFSLRGWDMTYNTHSIPKWRLTKMPRKTHLEETFFTSSVRVHYNYRHDTKKYQSSFLLDTEEEKIYGELHARQRREIKTDLTSEVDAKRIAGVLLGRFRRRNEIFQVAVGYDTSEINPLDTVELDMDVNGRRFSLHKRWRVREVNPAQDTLKLEAIGG